MSKSVVPDWVEKALYYGSAVFLLATTYKKVCEGRGVEEVSKILLPKEEEREIEDDCNEQ